MHLQGGGCTAQPGSNLADTPASQVDHGLTTMRTNDIGFYRDVFGGWRWEYFDAHGEAHDSPSSFDTRADCVADARLRGLTGKQLRAAAASHDRRVARSGLAVPSSVADRRALRDGVLAA